MYLEIPNITLLAIDAQTIIFLVVVLFSIIGGLQNLLKNQQNQPPKLGGRRQQQRQQAANRQPELQDEIDQFLEDVLGKDEVAASRREKEYREKEQRRKEQRARRRQPPPAVPKPKREALSERHLESSKREGVARHVEQHMQHLESNVGSHVARHLGTSSPTTDEGGSSAAHEIFAMLGNPAGMRQAILINEILSPPKSVRNRGGSL